MNIWNQDKYIKAWNFASTAHHGQLLPSSTVPYINHIGLVAMEAMNAIANHEDINNPDLLVVCALLHDTLEDTNTTFKDLEHQFGLDIAHGVFALSKDKNLPSKQEKMADSLAKIKLQPSEVWMVKLCDRITNLQPPPSHWDREKITRYRHEASLILEELGKANNYLAQRLESKIKAYQQYEA